MKHCIIVKFKESISIEEQKNMYDDIYSIFKHTKEIQGVHDIRLIPNCIDRPNRYHLVIEMDMDKETLPVYDASEWHLLWKQKYGELIEKKTIIDLDEPFTDKNRNWTVLLIGGASGTGKSTIAYSIADYCNVNVLEIDDIILSVKAVTTVKDFPTLHSGDDWLEIGVERNVEWLKNVSRELTPVLTKLIKRHLEDNLPVIIEGDFIDPEFTASFNNPLVKCIFINEPDVDQIIRNYQSREGGEPQNYRAAISIEYGKWIADICKKNKIEIINARPWNTALTRALRSLATERPTNKESD